MISIKNLFVRCQNIYLNFTGKQTTGKLYFDWPRGTACVTHVPMDCRLNVIHLKSLKISVFVFEIFYTTEL